MPQLQAADDSVPQLISAIQNIASSVTFLSASSTSTSSTPQIQINNTETSAFSCPTAEPAAHKRPVSKQWAIWIKRIYNVDPLICSRCGSKMKIVGFINDPNPTSPIRDANPGFVVVNHVKALIILFENARSGNFTTRNNFSLLRPSWRRRANEIKKITDNLGIAPPRAPPKIGTSVKQRSVHYEPLD